MRIAIYDLDNTLTRRATFTPFLVFAARRIAPWRLALLPVWVAMMIGYRIGLYDRTMLKTRGMRLMLGNAPVATLQEAGREFAAHRARNGGFMPATLAFLEEDRAKGAQILVATAAFEFYARAFADHLGIETLIGTRWDGHTIPGGNCYAETKLARVRAWAAEQGLSLEESELRFVSDSFADAPLLELADEAIFVSMSAGKRTRAKARGWRVISAD
ncbi:HAD family hydrolase [Qipengyuania soli]|uniref:HAD-IB family phosphatase n=1 Tax=Qipengyuania soli TaxID=2782568 RepID=A0A7S8F6G5_9SPHN|nr:HAD-IB family phosphatase [Qipengyuania soli]QPD00125.1 HAD-IB family phosphatase [Qipengyuania soli]